MTTAHVHAGAGVTGHMLLGALVGAGASVEGVEAAVAGLGAGDVKLALGRVRRGRTEAWAVRVRAPEQTGPAESWRHLQEILDAADLPSPVRRCALGALGRLVEAEAASMNLRPDDLVLPAVGALDELATIVGTCTAVHELGLTNVTVGPIGVGRGVVTGADGPIELPTFAVRSLLDGYRLSPRDVADHQLTTADGAALLAELATPVDEPPADPALRTGRGAGDRDAPHDPVLCISLHRGSAAHP